MMNQLKCKHCGKELVFDPIDPNGFYREGRYKSCDCPEQVKINQAIREQEKIKERENRLSELYYCAGITPRYKSASFENYEAKTKEQKYAVKLCRKLAEEYKAKTTKLKGLYLYGAYGTGKTHLVCAIANEIILNQLESYNPNDFFAPKTQVLFVNATDLLAKIKSTFGTERSEGSIIEKYVKAPLLILDDWGKEYYKKEKEGMSWADEKIFAIINGRYENMAPIIITSNLSFTQLERKIDGSIMSRLFEMVQGVTLVGEDYRKIS